MGWLSKLRRFRFIRRIERLRYTGIRPRPRKASPELLCFLLVIFGGWVLSVLLQGGGLIEGQESKDFLEFDREKRFAHAAGRDRDLGSTLKLGDVEG